MKKVACEYRTGMSGMCVLACVQSKCLSFLPKTMATAFLEFIYMYGGDDLADVPLNNINN